MYDYPKEKSLVDDSHRKDSNSQFVVGVFDLKISSMYHIYVCAWVLGGFL